MNDTNNEAPQHAVFSILLLCLPPWVQMYLQYSPSLLSDGYQGRFPGGKAGHSPPCSGNVKKGRAIHPLPPMLSWYGAELIKDWDNFTFYYVLKRRSLWPRGLGPAKSSPARTLGLWVLIPLKTWMFVCGYSVFVLGSGFARTDPRPRGPTDCLRLRNRSETKRLTDAL
jgi:hypothetical protein